MTKEKIIEVYVDILHVISLHGIDNFKKQLEKTKDKMSVGDLTIASSIIVVFDMLEKKEKK